MRWAFSIMAKALSSDIQAVKLLPIFTAAAAGALAARRVGDVPSNVTVHYVSQEVHVSEETEEMLPGQCVVAADVERRLLLEESADLEARADRDELDAEGAGRLGEVLERLDMIGSDTADRRADELLEARGWRAQGRGCCVRSSRRHWRCGGRTGRPRCVRRSPR